MGPSATKIRKPWALVLMGGGARGLAHIGVLQALEASGLRPDIVAGTSMGAMVGGFFASGLTPADLEKLATEVPFDRYLEKGLLSRSPRSTSRFFEKMMLGTGTDRLLRTFGVDREDRIEAFLKGIVGAVRIEDLPIPFACNAVDVMSGCEVIFTRGLLRKAIRASTAYPVVFEPARWRGRLFIDGGTLDNVPVAAARGLGARTVVVPDIHRDLGEVSASAVRNVFQLLNRTSAIVLAGSTERGLKSADFIYRVEAEAETFDFSKVRATVAAGRRATERSLAAIRRLVEGRAG